MRAVSSCRVVLPLALLVADASCFSIGLMRAPPRRAADVRMESLAQKMFGDVFGGLKTAADAVSAALPQDEDAEQAAQVIAAPKGADAAVSDLDERAQRGEVSFDDFLTMSSAFAKMGGKSVPGMPTLSATQLLEAKEKFEKHEKIVEVMMDDERQTPELLMEDLKAGGSTPGPRIQRLAVASGQPETEVALFLMQFEAMRESTRRIAEGEDPDAVNESMAAPPGANRSARRAAKKKTASGAKKAKKKM